MPELHAELAQEGANLLVDTLNNFSSCLESAEKQNNELATFGNISKLLWKFVLKSTFFFLLKHQK